jgi:tetratricopeptide (TPR) repeat protein
LIITTFSWAEEELDKTSSSELLKDLVNLEQNLDKSETGSKSSDRLFILKQLALLEELRGQLEVAQEYYYKAVKLAAGEEKATLLFELTRLLLEQGHVDNAKENLSYITKLSTNKELLAMSAVLEAFIAHLENEIKGSESKYLSVIKQYKGTTSEVKALLGLISLNYYQPEKIAPYLNQLHELAPESPEYALALGMINSANQIPAKATLQQKPSWSVKYKMHPLRLFMHFENVDLQEKQLQDSSVSSPTLSQLPADLIKGQGISEEQGITAHIDKNKQPVVTPETPALYVQTGSFSDKENAEFMILDLKKANFKAELNIATLNNRTYYKVLMGPFDSEDKITELLLKLKENGFEGFLSF